MPSEQPPFVGWFIIEVDVDSDRDRPVHSFLRGPFATEEKAQREKDQMEEAWQDALEEWDDGNPYEHKDWTVVEHKLRDFRLEKLEREDRESFEIRRQAAGAVGASLLAEEGIGPLAGEDDE